MMLPDLTAILPHVNKPARYTDHELNSVHKPWDDVQVKVALAFPDIYDIGMGHLGFKILYHIINERADCLAERVFAPWVDMEAQLVKRGWPLTALESGKPLHAFDIVGFTLQYELSYSNIVKMLDLGQIPRLATDRDARHPLIIAGGPCAFNVEPLADFFDCVVLGEGEEVILEILALISRWKESSCPNRDELLRDLASIGGVYVPRLYQPVYDREGRYTGIKPQHGVPAQVRKRIVVDLESAAYPEAMVVPFVEVVHDRAVVEILRGCTRGCRFCQAGMVYRPARERSVDTLRKQIQSLVRQTGYNEVSLTSLSSGDYSCIQQLVGGLVQEYREKGVAISLPSLRVDSFSVKLAEEIQRFRKTGLTFAPEAGSQRLRDVINKNVKDDDLFSAVRGAYTAGWRGFKLYFMIGLPTETYQDLDGLINMAHQVLAIGREVLPKGGKRPTVTVSVSTFVPKSHTPFQWEAQNTQAEIRQKQDYLRSRLRRPGITYQYHDAKSSFLEAVFARGDRRLAAVVSRAVDNGCSFDSWGEHFRFDAWMEAFAQVGVDPAGYANRVRTYEEALPWDHLRAGLRKEYLWQERQAAIAGHTTEDCRYQGCRGCQVCPELDAANRLYKGAPS